MLALGTSWFGKSFLGLQGPEGIGFAVLCLLVAFLMATVARTRLEMYPERLGKTLRMLTMGLAGVQVLAVNLWWVDMWYNRAGKAVQIAIQPPLAALIITASILMLLVPVFATGEISREEARGFGKYLASGWTPKGLGLGKMASGLPFLLLLTTFCLGLYALAFTTQGKTGDIGRSGFVAQTGIKPSGPPVGSLNTSGRGVPVSPPLPGTVTINGQVVATQPPGVPVQPPPPAIPHQTGDFREATIVLFASVIGFALFCQFLSTLCRNRWVAWLFASLFLILTWVLPALARASATPYSPPGISVNLFYFNPVTALCQMSENYNHAQYLLFETAYPVWQVTTVLWLIIGALSLLLTFPLVARQNRQAV